MYLTFTETPKAKRNSTGAESHPINLSVCLKVHNILRDSKTSSVQSYPTIQL